MNDFELCSVVVMIEAMVMVNDFHLRILSLYLKKQHLIWPHVRTYCVDLLKCLNPVYLNSHVQSRLVQYYSCSRWKYFKIHSCNKQLLILIIIRNTCLEKAESELFSILFRHDSRRKAEFLARFANVLVLAFGMLPALGT